MAVVTKNVITQIFQSLYNFISTLDKCDGEINLSNHANVTDNEFFNFSMSMLSLNKKHQFNKLILDNCNLSDESLIQLCRLIIKFEKVTLNGAQKITRDGWKHLAEAIKTPSISKNFKNSEQLLSRSIIFRTKKRPIFSQLMGLFCPADLQN